MLYNPYLLFRMAFPKGIRVAALLILQFIFIICTPLTAATAIPLAEKGQILSTLTEGNPAYIPQNSLDAPQPEKISLTSRSQTNETILLYEDFEDGQAQGWGYDSAGWQIITDDITGSHVWSTMLAEPHYATFDSATWSDYRFQAQVRRMNGDAILYFRMSSHAVNMGYGLTLGAGSLRLWTERSGAYEVLISADASIGTSWHDYVIKVVGSHISVLVDGALLFNYTDSGPASLSGGIALETWGDDGARFDNIQVTSLTPVNVGGSITQDTTWQGYVLVTNSVVVEPGVTLTVLPDTHVLFKHYRGYREPEKRLGLYVFGSIIADGIANGPIYFTSDAADPQNGDWSMLRLISPTGQSRFHYVVFEFAQQGLNVWQGSPDIEHVVFRWNNWEGVYFESYSQPVIYYCQIYENGYNGLAAEQSNTIVMDYCEISRNGTNGFHIDNSLGEIRRSRIHSNLANGLSVDDNGTLHAYGDAIYNNSGCGIGAGDGNNIIQVSNVNIFNNNGSICGTYNTVSTTYYAPISIDIGFTPDQSYPLGYIPGDQALDKYMYIYPDDETRTIVKKIGSGLGLTWSLAWDGQDIWTSTLWAHIYKLNPQTGAVLEDFVLPGSPTWGTPTQPWGMTFDDQGTMWLVDFAERKVFKVDPTTHQIIYSFDTPNPSQGGCKGIAWDGKYLNVMGWVSPVIYQMTKTGALVNTINLANGGGGGLAWDGEHFWVPGGGRIQKYDPQGHQVGWIYAASEGTWDMTWDGAHLWASQRTNENWSDAKIFELNILDDHDRASYLPLILRGQ